jgi:hypothetical protein
MKRVPTCRSCGAPIKWAEAASGKRIPFDLQPSSSPIDRWIIVRERCLLCTQEYFEKNPDAERYRPHWATCPHATKHRRRGPGKSHD